MAITIYSPQVAREARLFGITELQAYRKLQAREALKRRVRGSQDRRANRA